MGHMMRSGLVVHLTSASSYMHGRTVGIPVSETQSLYAALQRSGSLRRAIELQDSGGFIALMFVMFAGALHSRCTGGEAGGKGGRFGVGSRGEGATGGTGGPYGGTGGKVGGGGSDGRGGVGSSSGVDGHGGNGGDSAGMPGGELGGQLGESICGGILGGESNGMGHMMRSGLVVHLTSASSYMHGRTVGIPVSETQSLYAALQRSGSLRRAIELQDSGGFIALMFVMFAGALHSRCTGGDAGGKEGDSESEVEEKERQEAREAHTAEQAGK